MFGASSELASVMEFGFKQVLRLIPQCSSESSHADSQTVPITDDADSLFRIQRFTTARTPFAHACRRPCVLGYIHRQIGKCT